MSGPRRFTAAARWAACLTLALGIHAAGAVALVTRWSEDTDQVANAPVIAIELASLPVAPQVAPTELPPGPLQTDAQPEPEQQPEKPVASIAIEPQPAPQPELVVTPPPKPVEKPKVQKPRRQHASIPSAPSTAEHRAKRAAAPTPGAASHNPDALPNWKSQLVARLERFKRYPPQAHGDYGVAQLAFSVDRSGHVHHVRIVRSSGSHVLDAETLALPQRAAPLPPPPAEVSGTQIAIVVPIRYNYR
jgi:periplasmic protein TonB